MESHESYRNFGLAVYCTVGCLQHSSREDMEEAYAYLSSHVKLAKVYIETHRGNATLQADQVHALKAFFREKGVPTSGGITATLDDHGMNHPRFLGVICYSREENRDRLRSIVEFTATHFDEVILDDFYFTNCKCADCLQEKGDRSWMDFRLDQMTAISREVVCEPAKRVNPSVRMVIKYPNWKESFSTLGYNVETQPTIFDGLYTGTETRNNAITQQNIPRYGSYSLMRWFENVRPGANGGGWFDNLDCTTVDGYVEQALLTGFSKPREMTLFCWSSLTSAQSAPVPTLGAHLERLDDLLCHTSRPVGLPFYDPIHSFGEDHLQDYLGMQGIPFEPVPYFPEPPGAPRTGGVIMLAESAAHDPDVVEKLKRHLVAGGTAVVTTGFVRKLDSLKSQRSQDSSGPEDLADITSLTVTDRRMALNRYALGTEICAFREYHPGVQPISVPVVDYRTNDTWPHIVGFAGDHNAPVLLQDNYGKGRLYTLAVPDNPSDLSLLPESVLNRLRSILCAGLPVRVCGPSGIGLFLYDNDTFVLKSFLPHVQTWEVVVGAGSRVLDVLSNRELAPSARSGRQGDDSALGVFTVHLPALAYSLLKIM